MLSVYLGQIDQAIYHPPTYFDNQYEDEWITNKLSVEMIKDVDHSGKVCNASACGDNCAKWILKIGKEKDLTINLRHIMDFGEDDFEIYGLHCSEKYHDTRRKYQQMYQIYSGDQSMPILPDKMIAEDSNSGFQKILILDTARQIKRSIFA